MSKSTFIIYAVFQGQAVLLLHYVKRYENVVFIYASKEVTFQSFFLNFVSFNLFI